MWAPVPVQPQGSPAHAPNHVTGVADPYSYHDANGNMICESPSATYSSCAGAVSFGVLGNRKWYRGQIQATLLN
jgi:hypothetical protein